MEYPNIITISSETKEKEDKLYEKEYLFDLNNKSYKLSLAKDNQYLSFELDELSDQIILYHYIKKYGLNDLINALKVDKVIYNNFDSIVELINDAYINNKISIFFNKRYDIALKLKLKNGFTEYESNIPLNKRDFDINKKFVVLFKEINKLLEGKGDYDSRLKEFGKALLDLKENINAKFQKNMNLINNLKIQIEKNYNSLKNNKDIIQQLKDEIKKGKNEFLKFKNEIIKKSKTDKKTIEKLRARIVSFEGLFNSTKFSYQCINAENLKAYIYEGTDEVNIEVILKNNGIFTWPEGKTELISQYYSQLKVENIKLEPQNPNEEKKYEIKIKDLKNVHPSTNKIYFNFYANKGSYGDLLTVFVIVKEKIENYMEIKNFRDNFNLSEDEYPDDKLLLILKKHNFKYEVAFESLFD